MAHSDKIARNTTYLTIASIVQKIISFAYFGYLAVALTEAPLGRYQFALTFTSFFIIFMDFGLGPLLTREVSKNESTLADWYNRVLTLKAVLIPISIIALFISLYASERIFDNVTDGDVTLVAFASLIIIVDTITFTFFSAMRALKRLKWEAISIVLYQTAILIAGFTVLRLEMPLIYVLGALLTGSVVQVLFMFWVVRFKAGLQFRWLFEREWVKKAIVLAAPFAIAGVIFRLNGSIDTFMLKVLAGDQYVGWYNLAFKMAFALTVLPGAFIASFYPTVSAHFKHAKEKLAPTFENAMFYMLLLSLPITAGVLVVGDDLIQAIWKDATWNTSVQPLWILMLALPFIFMNYPVGNFLNAVNRQRLNTTNMCVALAVNAVINWYLIPSYTFNGAAVAAAISAVVLVLLGLPWVYKESRFNIGFLFKKAVLISLSAATMACILFMVQENYSVFILIPVGALIYVGTMLAVGGVTKDELQSLRKALLKK